jgi:hypothetical protein
MAEKTPRGPRKNVLRGKEPKLVKALAKTSNVSEAGRMAGYGTAQSAHRAVRRIQTKVPELMERMGLTDEYLLKKCLKPGLKAKETKFFADKGIVMDKKEVIAWGPRRDFLDMAFRLKGLYISKEGDGNGGNGQGNQSGGPTLHLEFSHEGAAREFAEAIASRRGGDRPAGLDAPMDEELGRA